ncbi:MAG: ATP-binding protein [Candidatus Eisenbacteria bacterium]
MSGGKSDNLMATRAVWGRRAEGCRKATQQCPCGYLGHPRRGCGCSPSVLSQYHARVSGPILDRLDLQVEVPALAWEELLRAESGEASVVVRERGAARARGARRRRAAPGRRRGGSR